MIMSELVKTYDSKNEFLKDPSTEGKTDVPEVAGSVVSDKIIRAKAEHTAKDKLDMLTHLLGQRPTLLQGKVSI